MATILVVDDSAVSRHLIGYTLKREGHMVLVATNGRQALDLLADPTITLVIADLLMPEMSGIELLNAIRSREQVHQVQLLMLTSSGQDKDRLDAQAAGANDFLTKPASSRDLIAAVDRLLSLQPNA